MELAQATRMLRQVVGTAESYKEVFLEVGSVIHSLILCPCVCVWVMGLTHVVQYSTTVREPTNKMQIWQADCEAARLKLVSVSTSYITGTRVGSRVACSCR